MIIDLHTHSKPQSDDSFLKPDEVIQQAKQAGIDAVCLTEHDWFWDKDDTARLSQEHDFLVLPGAEINTEEGHILVFGVKNYSFGMHRTEDLRHIVDEAGGVMIMAHPFRRHFYINDDLHTAIERCCQEPSFRFIDFIEVLNGRGRAEQNEFSKELCRQLDLKGTGGSDAHSFSDIPSCATYFDRKISNIEELIAELKAGRFRAVDLRQTSP